MIHDIFMEIYPWKFYDASWYPGVSWYVFVYPMMAFGILVCHWISYDAIWYPGLSWYVLGYPMMTFGILRYGGISLDILWCHLICWDILVYLWISYDAILYPEVSWYILVSHRYSEATCNVCGIRGHPGTILMHPWITWIPLISKSILWYPKVFCPALF